jgi:signal transduction histidine kinase
MTSSRRTRARRSGGYGRGVSGFLSTPARPWLLVAVDVVVAVALAGVVGFAALDPATPSAWYEPVWMSWLAAVLIAGPVAVRRYAPLPALAVSVVASVACLMSGLVPFVASGAPLAAVTVLLYLVGRTQPRRRSVAALVVCVAALVASALGYQLVHEPAASWLDTLYVVGFCGVGTATGWTIGLTARMRREYADHVAEQLADRAVGDERLRIARELHDVVAHSMSLIAVQAGIGNHVARARPAEAQEALRVIESTSRGSLAEMRHLLGVLRSEVDDATLAPAPGLAALADLAARAADAGVRVTLDVPDAVELPDGVELAVYRIVQEAVTNVVRHAAPAACRVTVSEVDGAVAVDVSNDGPAVRPVVRAGHGLIGMRERVAMYGGTFDAGPCPAGGFRVRATIPVGAT